MTAHPIYICTHDVDLPRDNRGHRRYAREDAVASLIEAREDGTVQVLLDAYTIYEANGQIRNHLFNTDYIVLNKETFEEFFIPQREYNKRWLTSLIDI